MSPEPEQPTPENIGDGPERRMTNFPPPLQIPHERLAEQPGAPRPEEADAVGEGAVEDLSQEVDGKTVEELERRTQADNARAIPNDPPPDLRHRFRESRPSDPKHTV